LTLFAPDIVEAILDGRQAEGITLPVLMGAFPREWERQAPEKIQFRGGYGALPGRRAGASLSNPK